ncbi:MAG: DUF4367 domain-containing protein [Clostridia bacterium]|nr:DUF4367 domain-containing protein [Clostridia bacterium]
MNKHDELVLKLIANEMLEEDDKIFIKEVEEAKNDPAFANTDISRKKMEKSIATELKKLEKNKKSKRKILARVASILLVLLLGVSATTLTVKGFREKVWAFILNIGNTTNSSVISSKDDYSAVLDAYEGKYIPTWIPEGYVIDKIDNQQFHNSIIFKNNSTVKTISFTEHSNVNDAKLNLHKEKYDNYTTNTIDGKEIIIAKQKNICTLLVKEIDAVILINFDDPNVDVQGFVKHIEHK